MDYNKIFQSKGFKVALAIIAGLIIFLLGFKAGTMIGFRKASFTYNWGENYHRNFGGPERGLFGNFSGKDFIDPHGAFGQIMKIDNNSIVMKDRNGSEKIVLTDNSTSIMRFRDNIKVNDLKVDDSIVVIGEPNDQGQIVAKLIRVLPPQNLAPALDNLNLLSPLEQPAPNNLNQQK